MWYNKEIIGKEYKRANSKIAIKELDSGV